jgi:hypothetical protein
MVVAKKYLQVSYAQLRNKPIQHFEKGNFLLPGRNAGYCDDFLVHSYLNHSNKCNDVYVPQSEYGKVSSEQNKRPQSPDFEIDRLFLSFRDNRIIWNDR